MSAPAPHGGNRPYNWPSLLVTLSGYALTFYGLFQLVRIQPLAHWHGSLPVSLSLLGSGVLVLCTLWIISLAYGFRPRLTVASAVGMGMMADLLFVRGLTLGFQVPHLEHLELALIGCLMFTLLWMAIDSHTEGLRRQQQEHFLHETDPLTGILNRRGLTRRYQDFDPAARVTIAMIDVNDLKAVNDQAGHGEGDKYLQSIVAVLRRSLPTDALLCRWGGDEFVAVVHGELDLQQQLTPLASTVLRPDMALPAYAVGTVTLQAGEPLERALALADEGMYDQKARQYADRAAQQNSSHIALAAFPHFLQTLDTLDTILDLGLRKAADLAGFETWLYIQVGSPLTVTYHERSSRRSSPGRTTVTVPTNRVIDAVVLHQETVWSSDYEHSIYAEPAWVNMKTKSFIAAPVKVDGVVTAVVAFTSSDRWRSVSPEVRRLLESVADHLGHQLERQDTYRKMQASVEAGITGMGILLEMRDLETAGHTQRVVNLALQLGRAAGLDAEALTALRLGAYLHDVGKLAIPDAVLLKPGALDPAEWALMQTHAEVGAGMSARLPSLPPTALEVVLSHHERWDGHGYPHGLSGDGIPLLARIFSVCDVYDALTHVRPYKEAWSVLRARTEIALQAGRQFDPVLTALFLNEVVADSTHGQQKAG